MTFAAPPSRRWFVVLLLGLAVLWFAGIDHRALMHPDEGRYAEIPREMLVTGDWLTPRLNGLKYFEKPPLQYWVTAAAYKVFGVHEWTARLWPALSTFLATLFLGHVGLRLGGQRMGLYTIAALGGCAGFAINAHILTLDAGLAAFLTLAFGAFVLAQQDDVPRKERRRWMWLAWAAMAGATLSKGPIGVVIPGASLVLYSIVNRDFAIWRRLHLVSGAIIYLALAAPWFIAVSLANPEFFDFFFINEHLRRFATTEHKRVAPWWIFVPLLIAGSLPWVHVLGWGVLGSWLDPRPARNGFSWRRFALVWAGFVFVFFSASGSKLPSYILPLFPVLMLLAASHLCEIDGRLLTRLTWPQVVLAAVALVLLVIGYDRYAPGLVPEGTSLAVVTAFGPWIIAAMAAVTIGGVIALYAMRQPRGDGRTAAVVITSLSMLAAVQFGAIGYDQFRETRSARDLILAAEAVAGPLQPDVPFYHVHMYDQTTPFYLNRTTTFVDYRDEFALGMDAEPAMAIGDPAVWVAQWEALPKGYAMMPVPDFERYVADGVPMRVLARDSRRVLVSRQ